MKRWYDNWDTPLKRNRHCAKIWYKFGNQNTFLVSLFWDKLHPTEEGYKVFAQSLKDELAEDVEDEYF